MVEVVVDPGFDDRLDVGEVDHHPAVVWFFGHYIDFDSSVVAVKVSTLAFVVQESMPVAEVDGGRYFVGHFRTFWA